MNAIMRCQPLTLVRESHLPPTTSGHHAHLPHCSFTGRQTVRPLGKRLSPIQAAAAVVVEELPNETKAAWRVCSARLEGLGMESDKADAALVKAFGWGGQGFWRQEKIKETPDTAKIEISLEFLASVGVATEADQALLIAKFPEVLALDPELMSSNVAKLQKAFFMKGNTLAAALKRKPRVLGSIVDCEGNCAGECTRCFAQF